MFSENFTTLDKDLIQEELDILLVVRRNLVDAVQKVSQGKLGEASAVKIGIAETKDEWGALFEQLHTYNALALQKGRQPLPDDRNPYFAHVVFSEGSYQRDLLIGYGTLVGSDVDRPIVDWKKSPAANLFFQCKEGDAFVQELPKRTAKGTVTVRRIVDIKNGKLVGVMSGTQRYYIENGIWCKKELGYKTVLKGGGGTAVRNIDIRFGGARVSQPELLSLLDEDQWQVMNRGDNESILVLGGAGSGKTTVALYRIAKLIAGGVKRESSLVIVPNRGLVNLCKNVLASMGIQKVNIHTFDAWVSNLGFKTFKGIPKKLCEVTPDEAIRIKRHPDFYKVLDLFLEKKMIQYQEALQKMYPKERDVIANAAWDRAKPFHSWFDRIREKVGAQVPQKSKKVLEDRLLKFRKEMLNMSAIRIELYTDEELLKEITKQGEKVSDYAVSKLVRHSREQFFERYNKVDVDKETGRHIALDGIDETEYVDTTVYQTIDVEDFPVLYYLTYRVTGQLFLPGRDNVKKYLHIMLDEAQELSLLEVKVLGHFLDDEGSVTIAGDAMQHTSDEFSFASWEKVLRWMEVNNPSTHRLKTNYRSTIPIANLSTYVLGNLAVNVPVAKKEGAPVVFNEFKGFGQAVVAMSDRLKDIVREEPEASVAVICKEEKLANYLFNSIDFLEEARLVLDGEFDFTPGIDVTVTEQVKGLEFDYVIIPDADSHYYKDEPLSRRSLYVAVTRAVYQLWIFSTANPSALIRDYGEFEKL